ncbi:THAP domain-containing protein 11-like [Argopecten irradians]|uniref:THAP domain-containing protein 11-like n=1 Tax=Argopecten irradians TaxID=31199 RepID=UPI00371A3576
MGRAKGENSKTKYWCAVPGCISDSRKSLNLDKYPWMRNVTFRSFPTVKRQPRLRSRWLSMIRRLDYNPKPWHRVCSRHFNEESDIPELFPWNNYKESNNMRSMAAIQKRETWKSVKTVTQEDESDGQQTDVDFDPEPRPVDENVEIFQDNQLPCVVCEMDVTTSLGKDPEYDNATT